MPELAQIQALASTIVTALGWMLIHFLWQGCAIAAAFWAVTKLARPDNAQLRYWAGLTAYMAAAIIPAITLFLQLRPAAQEAAATATTSLSLPAVSVSTGYHLSAGDVLQQALEPALPLVVVLWSLGVVLLSSRTFVGWLGTRRMTRRGVEPVAEELQLVVADLTAQLGIRRAVRVLRSVRVAVPTVIGWLKPVILLPASVMAELPRAQLEMIIAHELAHVRRNDYLVNLLQLIVETLFFYHPAVRWMAKQVRAEREHCCDDLVVEQCGHPVQYARALASLEALRGTPQAPALGANGGDLFHRVSRIVQHEMPRRSSGYVQVALAAAVAVTASLSAKQGMEMGLAISPASSNIESQQAPRAERFRSQGALGAGLQQYSQAERQAAEARAAAEQERLERESLERQRESDRLAEARRLEAERLANADSASNELLQTANPLNTRIQPATFVETRAAIEIDGEAIMLAAVKAPELAPVPSAEEVISAEPDLTARPVVTKAPDYPYRAFRDGIEGYVKLQFTVDDRGRVNDVRVLEAQPESIFDKAATKAMKKWRFKVDEGHNSDQKLYQVFDFAQLDENREQERSRRCSRTGSNICGQHYADEHVERYGGPAEN